MQQATDLKNQGNNFFNRKQFQKAVYFYSKSIQTYPLVSTYCNRSIAYTNLQKHQQALIDCEQALKRDSSHTKSLIRKGISLVQLLRIDEGIKVLEEAIDQDNDSMAKKQIQKAIQIKQNIEKYKEFRNRRDYTRACSCLNQIFPEKINNVLIRVSFIEVKAKLNKNEALDSLKSVEGLIDQNCSLFWYLKSVIQIAHGFKNRGKRYLAQSIRYLQIKPLKSFEKSLLFDFSKDMLMFLFNNMQKIQKVQQQISQTQDLVKRGQYSSAIRKLGAILESDVISNIERLSLLQLRIKCYENTNERPKYLNDMNNFLRMHPQHVEVLKARLNFHKSEKNYELALKDAQKLNQITGNQEKIIQQLTKLSKQNRQSNYYQVLGVKNQASYAQIKKAYKDLAVIYHPDKNRDLNLEEQQFAKNKFKEIKEAQTCLSNQNKRKQYDKELLSRGQEKLPFQFFSESNMNSRQARGNNNSESSPP